METQISSDPSSIIDSKKYKMIAENVTISYDGIKAVKDITMKFKENP